VARLAQAAFRNYGRMLADFLLLGALTPAELRERVSMEGLEHVDAALARGRGAIMAVPHMGSWDAAGSCAAALGYRVSGVAERFPGSLDQAVTATRERFGMSVIPLGRSAVRAITQALGLIHWKATAPRNDIGFSPVICEIRYPLEWSSNARHS